MDQKAYVEVELTSFERMIEAAYTAVKRHLEALSKGLKDKHGFTGDGMESHYWGRCGEVAYAKAMGQYAEGRVNTFKKQDVAGVQVRTRLRHSYELIVRDDDSDDEWFVLVTCDPKVSQTLFRVHGGIWGRDAKLDEWKKAYGDREPAWFVPQSALSPVFQTEEDRLPF